MSKRRSRRGLARGLRGTRATALAVLLLAAAAPAQDGGGAEGEEIRKLVLEIRRDMGDVQAILGRASEADERAARLERRILENLEKLFADASARQESILSGIDKLIESARYTAGSPSSPPPSGDPRRSNRQRREGSEDEELKKMGEPERAREPGDDSGGRPERPEKRKSAGQPPQGDRGRHASANGGGRWGDLPPKLQEVLRNTGTDSYPQKYRKWLEAYFRRLQDGE